ncbi:hypothetical protein OKW96_18595 [Sphingobacterium sp. KU25419]|nr:hypothetical protein OKW96_18595 [Sphingobacterium sp. KU25419]
MSYRDWVITKINSDNREDYRDVVPTGNSLIEIINKKGKKIIVSAIDDLDINVLNLKFLMEDSINIPNIIIGKSNAVWHGKAIEYVRSMNIGWGGLGDIDQAFSTDQYSKIQKKEFQFVENGLLNHTKVDRLERIYDRVFKIHRKWKLEPFVITLINSYELSAEEVRNARSKYGTFDGILKTNPNGSPTSNAYAAASEIDAEILGWRDLLGRLNKA